MKAKVALVSGQVECVSVAPMTKAELFWDVGSPYTHLAVTQVEGLRRRTGAQIELRPFLLGGVFKSAGNPAPASVPAKARYLIEDLRRWRDFYRVPMKLPPNEVPFPLNTLLPMRAAVAARHLGAGDAYCHAVFHAYWGEGRDVSLPDTLAEVARSIGLDPARLLEAASGQAAKDELRAATDEAVRRGAFGAPAIFVGDDLYFGNDRLFMVEQRLMEGGA